MAGVLQRPLKMPKQQKYAATFTIYLSTKVYIAQARTKCATLVFLLEFNSLLSSFSQSIYLVHAASCSPSVCPFTQLCFVLLFEIEWVNACRKCNAIKLCNMLISRAQQMGAIICNLYATISLSLPLSLHECERDFPSTT